MKGELRTTVALGARGFVARVTMNGAMDATTIDYLIRVLQDKSIDLCVRDDAAMDLGVYDEPRVLEALIQTAVNLEDDEMILDSCGESIREIWGRKGSYSSTIWSQLAPAAKSACNITGWPESD